ncbi:MAG: hypothetical protein AAF456_05825 [Planctomycetota bacterium]
MFRFCSFASMFLLLAVLAVPATTSAQSWEDDIGLTMLQTMYPGADGTGMSMGQVEAPSNGAGTAFLPNPGSPEMAGKTINDMTGGGINSSHALTVASFFAGVNTGVAPGVTDLFCYEANNYLVTHLAFGGGNPFLTNFDVENHSWVGNGLTAGQATELLQRNDWRVNQTNVNVVVGTGNNGSTPQLMAPGYNVISVGKTNGTGATGDTTFYGSGRQKPELVGPTGPTSFATGVVSGCAAILRQEAVGTDGENNESIKAMLLAGSTKRAAWGWSRTPARPIDSVRGCGEVNVYNSYMMLLAGETDGGATMASAPTVPLYGYDYGESIDPSGALYYKLDVPYGAQDVNIALTWNIEVTDTNPAFPFVPATSLANFDMEILDSSGGSVDTSVSTVNNLEHFYLPHLSPGTYTLRITSDTNQDFGLAWRADPLDEIVADSYLVTRGTYSSGDTSDLADSDNQDLSVQRNNLDVISRVFVEFKTTAPTETPTNLDLTFESSVFARSTVVQSIDLYDYDLDEWVEIDSRNATRFSDSKFTVSASGDVSRFVQPGTSCVEARVRYQSLSNRQQFTANMDHIFWSIQ